MKLSKHTLTRLEGEVKLKLFWSAGRVKDAYVSVPHFRGFERILVDRPLLDATIITPRVCGICGHAHLRATVEAIEDAFKREGYNIFLTNKAKLMRDITLMLEIIQNHIKWFYLYLMPDIVRLDPKLEDKFSPIKGSRWREGLRASNYATKALATLAGQWPHNSYMVPGGVTSDPTDSDIVSVGSLVNRIVEFFKKYVINLDIDAYLGLKGKEILDVVGGDLGDFFKVCRDKGLDSIGKSYKRFLTGGYIEPCVMNGVKAKRTCKFDIARVYEADTYSFFSTNGKGYSWAKAARYNGMPFETGPIARQIISKNPRVTSLFKALEDSVLVRVFARVDEILTLSLSILEKLKKIDLSEDSWLESGIDTDKFSGTGVGVVEAARGTLIHKLTVEGGRIKSYDIITPTVWNLGPRDDVYLGVVEKALIGVEFELFAYIVLRSFDVCSVCTSH